MRKAKIVKTPRGLKPKGEGWYVLNAADTVWWGNEEFGACAPFEGDARFQQYGFNIHVLKPGQPNCYYHAESEQEDFLVLAGEALLLVEGKEVPLKAWDLVHCPPWTEHVFVGAGAGPCAILMMGARNPKGRVRYPRKAVALKHGAGVKTPTNQPRVAYAETTPWGPVAPPRWPLAADRVSRGKRKS